jgi:hypothetical protein
VPICAFHSSFGAATGNAALNLFVAARPLWFGPRQRFQSPSSAMAPKEIRLVKAETKLAKADERAMGVMTEYLIHVRTGVNRRKALSYKTFGLKTA